jgi:iron complex outermembrane receptor protein
MFRPLALIPAPDDGTVAFAVLPFLLLCTLVAAPPAAAGAAPTAPGAPLEEIVVRASFRDTPARETTGSIAVLGQAELEGRAATHFEELIDVVPNLTYAGGTGRARFFQIRGIGERSQFSQPLNPSVGILVDQVDLSGAGAALTLLDVEQVEVLRGPQGTRYGANALAGLVNVVSRDPARAFGARVRAGAGSYDQRTLGAVLTGPVSSSAGYRLAVQQHRDDGFYRNAFLGRDDVNARDELTARAKVRWRPDEGTDVRVTGTWVDVDNGYDAFTLDNSRSTLSDQPGRDAQRTAALSVDARRQTGAVVVQGIAHVASSDLLYAYDEDWTWAGIDPAGYASTDRYARDRTTASAELRLLSAPGAGAFGDRVAWVAGAYLLDSRIDLRRDYTFLPGPFTSAWDFTTVAAFGELDTRLAERWHLLTGLRLERRESAYGDSDGLAFDPADDLWGGRVTLTWEATDRLRAFAGIARGYKAGGFNADGSLDEDLRTFGPEYLWELEAGVRTTFLDGRARLDVTVFRDWRRDQQVKSSLVRPRPDGSTEFVDFLGNAAEGTNRGLEASGRLRLAPGVILSAGLGLLDATFDRFVNEFGEDLAGREQAQAPDYTANLAVDVLRGPWTARLGVTAQDRYYFSDRHALRASARTLVNARVARRLGDFELALWGRNLTDRDYTVRGFGSFGNDPRKGYVVEPYVQYGEPRVWGLTLSWTGGDPS